MAELGQLNAGLGVRPPWVCVRSCPTFPQPQLPSGVVPESKQAQKSEAGIDHISYAVFKKTHKQYIIFLGATG